MFKSTDQRFDELVAVKVLKPDAAVHPASAVEFDHEGELLEALGRSRNVVGLLDSDSSTIDVSVDGTPLPLPIRFHVMELADGALSELLPVRHELDWADKLRFFRDVVAGVHQMHVKKMVHRDLKASNVLCSTPKRDGPSPRFPIWDAAATLPDRLDSARTSTRRAGETEATPHQSICGTWAAPMMQR